MKLESKFDIGQKVWMIDQAAPPYDVDCPLCEGTRRIHIKAESRSCPDCSGSGRMKKTPPPAWVIHGPMTVGQIRIEHTNSVGIVGEETFDNYKSQGPCTKEDYMCVETGIGSGSVWSLDKLFETAELAQTECDKRNTEHLE